MSLIRFKRKWGLFKKPRWKKYSKIVKMDTPENARKSVKKLLAEFRKAKTREKKVRILRVTQYAANRARVIATKKKRLSAKERREFRTIAKIYERASEKMEKSLKNK